MMLLLQDKPGHREHQLLSHCAVLTRLEASHVSSPLQALEVRVLSEILTVPQFPEALSLCFGLSHLCAGPLSPA